MFHLENLTDNSNIEVLQQKGAFTVLEYKSDLSVAPGNAMAEYFNHAMNVRRRQVLCDMSKAGIITQAGAMQWMAGNVNATTGIKGVGDLLGKALRSSVTKESAIKPEYVGSGVLALEPTYRHLLLIDVGECGGALVMEDGMFLACESTLQQKVVARSNLSSAVAGGEGFFNLSLVGKGVACLESYVPQSELVKVTLDNDVLKIDGNMAVLWSASLEFTVERSGKSLIGSAASGEGLVNVYRGTGSVWMAPVSATPASHPKH